MKITEQFKRVAEDIVQYQFTVDDPVTYPRPFTMSMPLTPLSGGVVLPYECHEGNLAVKNALSAERAEDRAPRRTWPKASCVRAAASRKAASEAAATVAVRQEPARLQVVAAADAVVIPKTRISC